MHCHSMLAHTTERITDIKKNIKKIGTPQHRITIISNIIAAVMVQEVNSINKKCATIVSIKINKREFKLIGQTKQKICHNGINYYSYSKRIQRIDCQTSRKPLVFFISFHFILSVCIQILLYNKLNVIIVFSLFFFIHNLNNTNYRDY